MIHVCVISLFFVLYLQANVLGTASKVKMLTKVWHDNDFYLSSKLYLIALKTVVSWYCHCVLILCEYVLGNHIIFALSLFLSLARCLWSGGGKLSLALAVLLAPGPDTNMWTLLKWTIQPLQSLHRAISHCLNGITGCMCVFVCVCARVCACACVQVNSCEEGLAWISLTCIHTPHDTCRYMHTFVFFVPDIIV